MWHRLLKFMLRSAVFGWALGCPHQMSFSAQAVPPARTAQNWAEALFPHKAHDFGVVARGGLIEHRFPVENCYNVMVRISAVRSTCGCTTAQVTKPELASGEKAELIVLLDTRKSVGREDSTVIVTLDLPSPAEVQLQIRSHVRADLVVEPGVIGFGSVAKGDGAHQKAQLTYTGSGPWRITAVERNDPAIDVRAAETGRSQGRIGYDLFFDLRKDAPVGFFRDCVYLVTSDPKSATNRVVIFVEGVVVPEISARPSPLFFGMVGAGQTVTRNLVIQARRAFRILSASGPDSRFHCTMPNDSKPVHVVSVTFQADRQPGPIVGRFTIQTDYPGGGMLEVTLVGCVGPVVPRAPPVGR